MAFQIKNFVSIAASMINRMQVTTKKITDFNIGSIARTLVEAVGIEIDQLYQQMFIGIKEAIPVATYNSFQFALLAAINASGVIAVTIAAQATDTVISQGTIFTYTSGATTYVASADVTITAGDTTANVLVAAQTAGILGNIPADTQFQMSTPAAGFISASNVAAFSNGRDLETEDQRKQRFGDYIQTLQRGTPAAIEYGAKQAALFDANGIQTERVQFASVVEPWIADDTQPIALFNVYVHNGVGSTSSDLVAQANKVIYGYIDTNGNKVAGWKAAGAKCLVSAATEVTQNIVATLTALPGYDQPTLVTQASAAIANYMLALDIEDTFQRAEAIYLVKSITGVDNFILTTPNADVTSTSSQKIMPGTLTIS